MIKTTEKQEKNLDWNSLYKLGGASAIVMVLIILIQLVVFIAWPPPLEGNALDWFELFQGNWLRGLLSFELLMVVYTILSIPIVLSLYIALKKVNRSYTLLYLVLCLIAIMAFIVARPVFEMLTLSNQYAAATSDAERTMLLSSGEVLLATFNGTAFYVNYILGSITGLIISIIMLKSNIFGRSTAYIRILSSILDFGLFIPVAGLYVSMFSVLFLIVWNVLVARKLFLLGRQK